MVKKIAVNPIHLRNDVVKEKEIVIMTMNVQEV